MSFTQPPVSPQLNSNSQHSRSPLRDVNSLDAKQMRKRAWWLIALNFLIPGSAQMIAGSRKIGRVAFIATLLLWALFVIAGLLALVARGWLLSIFGAAFLAEPIAFFLWFFGGLTIFLAINLLRMLNLNRLVPGQRLLPLIALVATCSFAATTLIWSGNTVSAGFSFVSTVFKQQGTIEPSNGRYNIMLLGGDSGSDRFGLRPDSISVLSISATTGAAVNIGIPRNMQNIHFVAGSPMRKVYPKGFDHYCGGDCMINAIYKATTDNYANLYPDAKAHGSTPGLEATRDAVEWVTGLKIQNYALINMKAFASLIDAIGGIDVNVKKALPIGGQQDCVPANNAHLSDCPDALGWIEVGKQHMDGHLALWYARSRHNTNDYDRMRRQRQVEDLVLKKIDPITLLTKFGAIAKAGAALVKTDIPAGAVGTYVDLAFQAKKLGIKKLELVSSNYPRLSANNPDFRYARVLINRALKKNA